MERGARLRRPNGQASPPQKARWKPPNGSTGVAPRWCVCFKPIWTAQPCITQRGILKRPEMSRRHTVWDLTALPERVRTGDHVL